MPVDRRHATVIAVAVAAVTLLDFAVWPLLGVTSEAIRLLAAAATGIIIGSSLAKVWPR